MAREAGSLMIEPMLASLVDAPLNDPQLIYEPKYDGIRAIAEIEPRGAVRLWSRLGNEKTAQFPEIVAALKEWAQGLKAPLVIDGEIVALDGKGNPSGFQQLQGRIHLTENPASNASLARTAFIAFDALREGRTDLRERPLTERRAALERIFGSARSSVLRISESVRGDGRDLYKRALAEGWEGLIAKQADSRYRSGKRSPDWRKVKIVREQEFVIGGWTEPRQTRSYFGALLLGVYRQGSGVRDQGSGIRDQGSGIRERNGSNARTIRTATTEFVYVGHVGTGFNEKELARLMKLLKPLETAQCPFRNPPKSNERPHWVKPALVAQVKFTEWTSDGRLRHPVYLGLRDDKKAEDVRREPEISRVRSSPSRKSDRNASNSASVAPSPRAAGSPAVRPLAASRTGGPTADAIAKMLDQLSALEANRRDGSLELPDGDRLSVTNLHKVFWPKQKRTKGDLLRYYVQASPFILPAVQDRPLTMKRLPNGIAGKTFYQHRAPDEVPANVRVEPVPGEKTVPARLIGGNLKTLLYMAQLAAISQDPWFSRVTSPDAADHVAFDLDPAQGVRFDRVLEVARWIRDELQTIGAVGFPKTSGADGLHVYIPLPPDTPYEAGLIFCQIIATMVAQKHAKIATIERSVKARGPRVYIDCLQNIAGKTLAMAYSARASTYAGVSTPLSWDEVEQGVRREDFTIETIPERLKTVGDLWKGLRTSKGIDLSRVSEFATGEGGKRRGK
jgi:bifunctional non-homologous end joining protein LigD